MGLIFTGNARTDASVRTHLSAEQLYQVLKEAAGYCYANNMEINFTSPGWIAQEKLQELGLDMGGQLADLIQEQRAVVGQLDLADLAGGGGPGEGALLIAEQL